MNRSSRSDYFSRSFMRIRVFYYTTYPYLLNSFSRCKMRTTLKYYYFDGHQGWEFSFKLRFPEWNLANCLDSHEYWLHILKRCTQDITLWDSCMIQYLKCPLYTNVLFILHITSQWWRVLETVFYIKWEMCKIRLSEDFFATTLYNNSHMFHYERTVPPTKYVILHVWHRQIENLKPIELIIISV